MAGKKYQKWTTVRNYLILLNACNSKAQMKNIRRQIEEARTSEDLNDYNADLLLSLANKIEHGGLDK